jgi:hypothetical protein
LQQAGQEISSDGFFNDSVVNGCEFGGISSFSASVIQSPRQRTRHPDALQQPLGQHADPRG